MIKINTKVFAVLTTFVIAGLSLSTLLPPVYAQDETGGALDGFHVEPAPVIEPAPAVPARTPDLDDHYPPQANVVVNDDGTITVIPNDAAAAVAADAAVNNDDAAAAVPTEHGFDVAHDPLSPDFDPSAPAAQEGDPAPQDFAPFEDPDLEITHFGWGDSIGTLGGDTIIDTTDFGELFEQLPELAERPSHQVRLGALALASATGHDRIAHEMTAVMTQWLETVGLYEVFGPDDLDRMLRDSRARVRIPPSGCSDERCAYETARALELRRMIFGSLDYDETTSRYAVRLTLLNAVTAYPVATQSVIGAAGVGAEDVLAAALSRLHGVKAEIELSPYYGPSVNNMNEFLWSTLATQGAGLLYAAINYLAGNSSSRDDLHYVPGGAYTGGGTLSGLSGSSNQIPIFARPAALANAYTAVSDDAYGVLYNPAGMAWLTRKEAVIAYQYRFGMDLLAASYANRAHRDLGFGQAVFLATDRDGAMTELFFVTAAGYRVNQSILFGPMSFGASLKIAGSSVRALSPDSPSGQSYGAGLDLGFMWELSRSIRYGLMLRDVPSVNRWTNRATGAAYNESNPPTLHMGGAYRASYSTFLTADGQIPLYADQPWLMAGGIEYEFFRILALRIGLQREILNEESNWWKITGGAGIKIDTRSQWGQNMELDVAYEYNTLRLFPVVNVSVRVGF